MMRKERSTEPNLSNSQGVVPNVGGLSGSYVARFTVHRMLDVCLNTSFSFVHSPVTSPNEKQTNQSLVITNLDSNAGCCHCKTFFVQILVETEKTQLTNKKQQPTTSNCPHVLRMPSGLPAKHPTICVDSNIEMQRNVTNHMNVLISDCLSP